MKNNWFLKYEKDVLYSLINKKRLDSGYYRLLKDDAELNRIIRNERFPDEDELESVKRIINEVRAGRIL